MRTDLISTGLENYLFYYKVHDCLFLRWLCMCARVCVFEKESVCLCESVCVFEKESVCLCDVCVFVTFSTDLGFN